VLETGTGIDAVDIVYKRELVYSDEEEEDEEEEEEEEEATNSHSPSRSDSQGEEAGPQ
jgi:hypothetical protein